MKHELIHIRGINQYYWFIHGLGKLPTDDKYGAAEDLEEWAYKEYQWMGALRRSLVFYYGYWT